MGEKNSFDATIEEGIDGIKLKADRIIEGFTRNRCGENVYNPSA